MSVTPTVDDLRLVEAVYRHGSIGAAARELLITQPSASARLAALERRLETRLFERDTTGARATDAGRAFADEAEHILGHLSRLPDRVRAGAAAPLLRAGTFPSLAAVLFPALDAAVRELSASDGPARAVDQLVEHGDTLIEQVGEGSLDLAVVGVAGQIPLPARVGATTIGRDRLVLLDTDGSGERRRLSGVVPYHCIDMSGPMIEQRISALGGMPRRCATAEVAVITARTTGQPALLAGSIAALYRQPAEAIHRSPFSLAFSLQAVTRSPRSDVMAAIVGRLGPLMGLKGVPSKREQLTEVPARRGHVARVAEASTVARVRYADLLERLGE